MDYTIFLELAIIIFAAKILGLIMRRLGLPQVLGGLIAGILLGPALWGGFAPIRISDPLTVIAEIGVIMILFTAGLETNFSELKKNAKSSLVIMILGVVVPLGFGFLITGVFFGFSGHTLKCLALGTILTATSVGVLVETLKEMGKLKGKVGTTIMSATVLDDIVAIIILCVVISINDAAEAGSSPAIPVLITFAKIFGFFAGAAFVGFFLRKFLKFLEKKYPHHRRLPILGLCACFFFAWVAEVIGIADVTGAFVAGVIFSNIKSTEYIEKRIDIGVYLLFAPVFLAHIGLMVSFAGFTPQLVLFALCFLLVGVASKVIGCGGGALMCGYSKKHSLRVGIGMVARGEFTLIAVTRLIAVGILTDEYVAIVVMLVVVTSVITPLLLKLAYRKPKNKPLLPGGGISAEINPPAAAEINPPTPILPPAEPEPGGPADVIAGSA